MNTLTPGKDGTLVFSRKISHKSMSFTFTKANIDWAKMVARERETSLERILKEWFDETVTRALLKYGFEYETA